MVNLGPNISNFWQKMRHLMPLDFTLVYINYITKLKISSSDWPWTSERSWSPPGPAHGIVLKTVHKTLPTLRHVIWRHSIDLVAKRHWLLHFFFCELLTLEMPWKTKEEILERKKPPRFLVEKGRKYMWVMRKNRRKNNQNKIQENYCHFHTCQLTLTVVSPWQPESEVTPSANISPN